MSGSIKPGRLREERYMQHNTDQCARCGHEKSRHTSGPPLMLCLRCACGNYREPRSTPNTTDPDQLRILSELLVHGLREILRIVARDAADSEGVSAGRQAEAAWRQARIEQLLRKIGVEP